MSLPPGPPFVLIMPGPRAPLLHALFTMIPALPEFFGVRNLILQSYQMLPVALCPLSRGCEYQDALGRRAGSRSPINADGGPKAHNEDST